MSNNAVSKPKGYTDKELEEKVRKLLLKEFMRYKDTYTKDETERLLYIALERAKVKSEHYIDLVNELIRRYDTL